MSARGVTGVIFDLGGVLVSYDREDVVRRIFPDPAAAALAESDVLARDDDWAAIDRGLASLDDIARAAARRTGLPQADLLRLLRGCSTTWTTQHETVELLRQVKARGLRTFCLSNMGDDGIAHLEATQTFWDLFDGIVISCRVGYCKPQPEVYAHLLVTHALDASRTVFIDDMPDNLAAAAKFGIRPLRFESAAQCARALRALGCL
ncbi:MAG TPA: HAD family phosphatase [Terriglobales bacterium]|nr:HAD family phosphatase [Terriglobales bacterium]